VQLSELMLITEEPKWCKMRQHQHWQIIQ